MKYPIYYMHVCGVGCSYDLACATRNRKYYVATSTQPSMILYRILLYPAETRGQPYLPYFCCCKALSRTHGLDSEFFYSPGRDKKGSFKHETVSKWRDWTITGLKVFYFKGFVFHGTAQDGTEKPLDFNGREFHGTKKKHGTPRDGIEISRDFTGRQRHGTSRDGIEMPRDCTGRGCVL